MRDFGRAAGTDGRRHEAVQSICGSSYMSIERIQPPNLHGPTAYAHVARVTGGSLIFIAGQVPVNAAGEVVGKGDFAAQVEQVFSNLTSALAAAGADWSNVVKVVQYIPSYDAERHRPALGAVRQKYMVPEYLPVSTLLGIQALASPDFLIEIDAIAAVE
jgi:enamine deaminase RidA (YjgF/YER057c/UK114 family)